MTKRRKPLTIALAIVGAIIGLVAVLAGAGALLPRDHTAQVSLAVAAPRDRVWAIVSDFAHTPGWRTDVTAVQVEARPGERVRFIETTSQGSTPFEVMSQEAPARQVVRVVDDGLPFGGTWTWELAASGDGTTVTITEAGFIRNPVFRVMSRVAFPPTATMETYLRSLAAALGEGAEPVVLRAR